MFLYWILWGLAISFDLLLLIFLGRLIFTSQRVKLHYFDEYIDTEKIDLSLPKKNPEKK